MAKQEETKLKFLPVGAIRPEGWLKDELELINSLQKRLGALPYLENGEWTEGEAYPRYTRGLVLLAGALNDETLKDKLSRLILPIFNSANEGGDFGPDNSTSQTPKIEAVKTLLSYYELTGDERVVNFLKKFFKNQFNTLSVTPYWHDSRARLLEEIPALETVFRLTDLDWLKDLAEQLRDMSADYFRLAAKFPYKHNASKYISKHAIKRVEKLISAYELTHADVNPRLKPFTPDFANSEWDKKAHRLHVETNGVNLAKAVKYPCVYGRFMGDDDLKKLSLKLIASLLKYHGTAAGMFTCDNRLAGLDPTRGIDVEAASEMLESLTETLLATKEFACADLIEQIVFNLIPGACLDDAGAVQDLLLVNQIEASELRKHPDCECPAGNAFITKKTSRGAIGALTAFPTYMRALCLNCDNEISFMSYAPCTIDMKINCSRVLVKEETGYPFRNTVVFNVLEADGEPEVKLNFRVPAGATMKLVSGGQTVASGTRSISVKCVLKTGSTFLLKMDIPLRAVENRDRSISLMKANVLMAAKIPYEAKISRNDPRYIDLNFTKKWNFAPVIAKKQTDGIRGLYTGESTKVNAVSKTPFSGERPPFELSVRCKNVLNWDYDVNGFTEIPSAPDFSEESLERVFVPFGCTNLRVAQFPKCAR